MDSKLLAAAFLVLFPGLSLSMFAQQPAADAHPAPPGSQPQADAQPALGPKDLKIERAKIFMATKRYEAAIKEYQDLLKTEPRNAQYMNMIGICYLNVSDFGKAKKYFQRAAKADKKFPSPVNNLGMVWYQQKNYRRAIREYQKAIAIDPGQAGVWGNLGFAYYNTKKYPEAANAFRRALEIDPRAFERNERVGTMMQDRSVSNKGMFFFMMAREYAQLGDAEHCAEYLRKSLDEGYPEIVKVKTDPAFQKVLADPGVQGVLQLLKPPEPKTAPTAPGA
jgi:tetratricopeptide (TPR) repeat protein